MISEFRKTVGKLADAAVKVEQIGNKIADLNGIEDVNGGTELIDLTGSAVKRILESENKEEHQDKEADDLPEEMTLEEPSEKSEDDLPEEMSFAELPEDALQEGNADKIERHADKGTAFEEVSVLPDEMGFTEAEDNPDNVEKKKMEPPVKVTFTCKEKYDKEEYERQVKNQEKGMNNLSLYDYCRNREKYQEYGRDTDVGAAAQEKARQEARADRTAENRRKGMSREEAEKEANEWMETQAALHDPDQIAGGDASNVTGMGDKEINSSIGSQWQYRIDSVDEAVRKLMEENNLTEDDLKNTYLNVELEVNKE